MVVVDPSLGAYSAENAEPITERQIFVRLDCDTEPQALAFDDCIRWNDEPSRFPLGK